MSNEDNKYGLISMICGIVSVITCCLWLVCIPLAVISIIYGVLQIKKGTLNGMAVAGIVCSIMMLLFQLLNIALGFSYYLNNPYQLERMLENYLY